MHQSSIPSSSRYSEVRRVLVRIFVLNLLVAVTKILFGHATGTISILSDGYHSLTDGASNIAALVGLRVAHKPPVSNHPNGHMKFETLAAGVIAIFLIIIMVEVGQAAYERFRSGGTPRVNALSFAV